ncbi:MAG: sensor histidine kinase, partial [Acidimicrobiia bacterium]
MLRTGPWFRIFLGLLVAILPPLLLLVGAVLLTESVLTRADPNLVAIFVVIGAIGWAAILGVVYGRALDEDLRAMLSVAERGEPATASEMDTAAQQLAATLEERNRQVDALASEARAVPIDAEPRRVATSILAATRSVMRDPTWRLAVLASEFDDALPHGSYTDADEGLEPVPVGDLEQWAAVSVADGAPTLAYGAWGAFALIPVSVSDRVRAILYAPWEGRPVPTAAERAVWSLVGQHAGVSLEHSLLYARVRRQADELDRMARIQSDFLRGVTHDLQTPLTSIGALATEIRAEPELPERARADLETIAHQAERLRRMVSQLLTASRLEAGVLVPQSEVFAVGPIIQRTWSALRADRPFELVVEGEPHLAVGDPDRFEQVLWALLDNAVKYSPAGSAVNVNVRPADASLLVAV